MFRMYKSVFFLVSAPLLITLVFISLNHSSLLAFLVFLQVIVPVLCVHCMPGGFKAYIYPFKKQQLTLILKFLLFSVAFALLVYIRNSHFEEFSNCCVQH